MGAKNTPTNPKLWSRAKSLAKSKFDVYPSAYANGWAAKWYKSKGGGWKSSKEESYTGSGLNYNKLTHYACTNCPHKWDTLNSIEGATTCWSCGHQGEDLGLVNEDLRKWFGKGKEGGHGGGGWDRYNSKGERIGKCAREPGEPKPKCLSREKAAKMTKKEIAAAVKRKRKEDPVADRLGKGGKPVMSSNKIKESFVDISPESKTFVVEAIIEASLNGTDLIDEISKRGVMKGIASAGLGAALLTGTPEPASGVTQDQVDKINKDLARTKKEDPGLSWRSSTSIALPRSLSDALAQKKEKKTQQLFQTPSFKSVIKSGIEMDLIKGKKTDGKWKFSIPVVDTLRSASDYIKNKLESADILDEALPKTRKQSSFPRKLSMLHPTVKRNLDKRAKDKSYKKPEAEVEPPVKTNGPKPKVVTDKESKDKVTVFTRDDYPEK